MVVRSIAVLRLFMPRIRSPLNSGRMRGNSFRSSPYKNRRSRFSNASKQGRDRDATTGELVKRQLRKLEIKKERKEGRKEERPKKENNLDR